jgi:hypothetical protein
MTAVWRQVYPDAMGFSYSDLHLIAYMEACRELSDSARGQVSTYGEARRRGGELVEDAARLVADAEEVLRLAIAAERAASTPRQEIGERLGVTRQSAHERYAAGVQEISDGVLFPTREPENDDGLGWWACPDGLEDPEATVRRLDEWARHHSERTDPERGEKPVSGGLGRREDLAAVEAIGLVTTLAKRIMNRDLPPGVSERQARRLLLERKVEAFGLIMRRESGHQKRDALAQHDEAWDHLVAWHREDLEQRLTVDSVEDAGLEGYRFALDGRPVARLAFTVTGDEDTGWHLLSIDAAAFEAAPEDWWRWAGDPWPVEIAGAQIEIERLVQIKREQGTSALFDAARPVVQRTRAAALAAARLQLLGDLASDLAKGVDPFDPSGMAGPRPAEQPS